MKKNYFVSLLLAISVLGLLLAFSTGPPAGYSGSPLDGQNCTSCHLPGPAEEFANLITTTAPAQGYSPGETYTVTVKAKEFPSDRIGFQITSETTTAKAGSFVITDPGRTQLVGPSTVTHTLEGTTPIGTPNTWTMDWVAPPEGTGTVTFAVALNSSNFDGMNSGDIIYVSGFNMLESNTGIVENPDQLISQAYPNPANDHINLGVPVGANVQVFNISGQPIFTIEASNNSERIDLTAFPAGRYIVRVSHEGQFASRSFIKH